jgi:hypothetical protein
MQCIVDIRQNTETLKSKKRKRIKVKETIPIVDGIPLYLLEKVKKFYSKLIPAAANSTDIEAEMKQKLIARY